MDFNWVQLICLCTSALFAGGALTLKLLLSLAGSHRPSQVEGCLVNLLLSIPFSIAALFLLVAIVTRS